MRVLLACRPNINAPHWAWQPHHIVYHGGWLIDGLPTSSKKSAKFGVPRALRARSRFTANPTDHLLGG
jgi:hypothetical protein